MVKLLWPRAKIYDDRPGVYDSYEYDFKQKEWNRTSFEATNKITRLITEEMDRQVLDEILGRD